MEFNRDCADWVYDTITAMDPDEQVFFAKAFVYDLWQRDISTNRRTLGRIAKKLEESDREFVAKECLAMLENGEDEKAVAVAASYGVVSKEHGPWEYQERNHGRFGRMMSSQWKKQLKAEGKAMKHEYKAQQERAKARGTAMTGKITTRGPQMVGGAKTFAGTTEGTGWNAQPDPNVTSSQTWNRVQAGGNLASTIGAATGKTGLQAAGEAARYAGQFGPEAEKVVGPALRRSAYRYRGTERTPDKKLTALTEDAAGEVLGETGRGATAQTVTLADGTKRQVQQGKFATLAPEEKVYASEQAAMRYLMGGTHKGQELKSRIPTPGLSGLHRESGKITPSEGIMINANGEITHQAVGFAEDHYLPFNLKNLSDLKGGSYVRTRESGGLTTEDIYTGLISGARSMTVVSNSGTFTVDFDDELRGGRRYNDKAAQMVGRYAQTLDAVQSNQVENPARSLGIEERAKIRSTELKRIEDLGLNVGASDEQIDNWVKQAMDKAKKQPQLSPQEIEHIDVLARRANEGDDANYERDKKALLQEAMQDKRSRNYQLDSEGYEVALNALREQFPYYIADVRVTTKKDDPESRKLSTKVDRSYVKAKHIRPEGARAGWYDTTIGGQKHGADTENYQNFAWRQGKGASSGKLKEEDKTEAGATGTKKGSLDEAAQRKADNLEGKENKKARAQAVIDDADEYADNLSAQSGVRLAESSFPTLWEYSRLRSDADAKTAFQADEQKVKDLEKEMKQGKQYLADRGSKWVAPSNLSRFDARQNQGKYSAEASAKGETSPLQPPKVSNEDYRNFVAKPEVQTALQQHAKLDDAQLRNLSNKQRQALVAAKESQPDEDHADLVQSIQNIELLRALKEHMAPAAGRTHAGVHPPGSVAPVPKVTSASISPPGGQAGKGLSGAERTKFVQNDLFSAVGPGGGQAARQIDRLEGQFSRGGHSIEDYNDQLKDILTQSNIASDVADDLWNKLNR